MPHSGFGKSDFPQLYMLDKAFKGKKHDFSRYIDYMHGQVHELVSDYGKLDIMWFDFSYDNMKGEAWRAADLVKMVRKLQPDIIIDNRLETEGTIKTSNHSIFSGDFASPEQIIPPVGIVDDSGNPIPWEACITLNNNWGYVASDNLYKSPKMIIRKLVECVSKNGNLLLNVGPNAKGEIPEESLRILNAVGMWMRGNSASIYNCGKSGFPKPEWGRYTQKDKKLYAHIFEENVGAFKLQGLADKIKHARLLRDGSEIFLTKPWNTVEYEEDAFVNFGKPEHFTFPLPDEMDTVIELELL